MYHIPLFKVVELSQAGGKAANLARATRLGFHVPGGFVLPRAALRLFLEANQFLSNVQATLGAYEDLEWHERMERFAELSAAAGKLPVPKDVHNEVEPIFLELLARSPAGVAVRSSGICEDLEGASFAGIYQSTLGVTDLESFWRSVYRCWCSTWSPQAAAYARKMGISIPSDGMGVLVQTMIPAESSGVAFTADPVTGNPWHFVINAVFGLASGLVDGSAPADRFVLAWDSGEIIAKRIETKPGALVFQDGRLCEVVLPERQQHRASLSDEQVQLAGQMALAVDRAFDRRMDLEWAVAGGQITLIQARPMTALPPFFPHELSEEDAEETWTPYLNSYATMNERERLVAPFHRQRWLLELWDHLLTPDDIFPRRSGKERDFNGYRYTTEWRWVRKPADWPRIEGWLDDNELRLRQGWLAQLERVRQANAWADAQILALSTSSTTRAADWVRITLAYVREECEMQAAVWYASQWMIFTCEAMLTRFIEAVMPNAGIPDLPAGLLQGLSCYSVERTIAAQALGRDTCEKSVRVAFAERPLSQVVPFLHQHDPHCTFLRALMVFCRTYGMDPPSPDGKKNAQELDLDGVLLMVKAGILEQGVDAKNVLAEGAIRRQAGEVQVRDWLHRNQPDVLARFNKLLGWAQFWTPVLDNRKWHVTMTVRLRKLYQITKEALVGEGLIDQPDHFLLLTPQDWAAYVEYQNAEALRSLYLERKLEYERDRRLEPLAYLGKPPESKESSLPQAQYRETKAPQETTEAKRSFQGEGIATGKARGIAYQVASLDNFDYLDHLSDEHILICGRDVFNAQWQRDWYSLFMVVRGLITIQGAQLHHATQIARECGVPFINLPGEDLENLPDGVVIEIDGQAGTLILL